MAIRYDKKLNQEIYRTVYEFNKKVKSLSHADINVKIPELITTKDLKTKDPTHPLYSYNRQELRRKLKSMQRFLKPGQEAVIVTPAKQVFSKWEYRNLQNQRRTAINRIKKQLKAIEQTQVTYAGRKLKYTYAQMGSQQYVNLQQKLKYLEEHQLSKLSGDTLTYYKKFLATNTRAKRDKEWKENFLDIVLNLGYEYGEDVSQLRQKLSTLSPQQFLEAFNQERLLKDLVYYYKLLDETQFDKAIVEDDVSQMIQALEDNIDAIILNARKSYNMTSYYIK